MLERGKKILILGYKGNLGSQLMEVLSELEPVGWDREELDVTDEQKVWDKIHELSPYVVFNCTAYNAVDQAEDERAIAENINGYAVGHIAKACKASNSILVHYSSGMVFDGKSPEGYSEDDLPSPVNEYGRSKLLGEMEAQENMEKLYIIRTSWLFGKPGPGAANKKSFIDLMLEKAREGKISVVDDEFGKPTYILDLAQASRALVEMGKDFGIYHMTNSGSTSRLDWAREIFKARGLSPDITALKGNQLARKATRPKFEILSNSRFIEFRPWTEALKDYLS